MVMQNFSFRSASLGTGQHLWEYGAGQWDMGSLVILWSVFIRGYVLFSPVAIRGHKLFGVLKNMGSYIIFTNTDIGLIIILVGKFIRGHVLYFPRFARFLRGHCIFFPNFTALGYIFPDNPDNFPTRTDIIQ